MRVTGIERAAQAVRVWLCFVLLWACSGLAWADSAGGLAWLQAQVQSTGGLASASGSATASQGQCEAARTLLEFSDPARAASLTAALDAAPVAETATEVLACTQWLQQQQSQIPRASELQGRRAASGGFATYDQLSGTSALDTGWALQALAGAWSAAQAEPTLAWLQQQQAANGSFTVGGRGDLLGTATVLRGLREHRQRSALAAAIADRAAAYLLSQADPAGHWQSDAGITALVYEAVHPYSGALPDIGPSVKAWLLAAQGASGAWGGNDPWATALALRALALAERPAVNPAQAALRVQFIDARNGNPIPAVQLTGPAGSGIQGLSDASGQIRLAGLPPGAYTLTASTPGYRTVQTSATLRAGVVTDLGTLQMLVPGNSTSAVITGTIKDSASGAPLGAVTVSVAGRSLSATTDAAGRYLISDVAPGTVGLVASRAGYYDATGQADVLAGQTLDFSPALVRSPATGPGGATDCRILGRVTKAADTSPIAGATVSLSGANTGNVLTDADGAYVLAGLVSGDTRISVSQTGYGPAEANTRLACSSQSDTAVQYSPRLHAGSQSPPDANRASLSGIVLDARNNQPIAAAQLSATTSTGIVRTTTSQADGRFAIGGLDGASVQLVVAAPGYEGFTASYLLQPAQDIDLGQLRLRPPRTAALAVDLQVQAVRRHTLQTDPQTLRVLGALQVQVRNAGTQPAPANVPVLAFLDTDSNGRYDAGTDTVLGQATLSAALASEQSQTLEIVVAGMLPFRDAPIHVIVDPEGAVPESDKSNNVRSSAQDVLFTPSAAAFSPKLKWHWDGSQSPYPDYNQVMMAPVVGRVVDTNGDGRLDSDDRPVAVFTSFSASLGYNNAATIRVVDGKTGVHLLSIRDDSISAIANLALADLDGDGKPEIIAITRDYRVVAFRNTGDKWWVSDVMVASSGSPPWGAPYVADIDRDGRPEIIFGLTVLNFDGTTKWRANGPNVGTSYERNGGFSIPVAADIEGRGNANVIFGGSLYSADGTLVWQAPMDGYTAVASFDGKQQPSIAIVHSGQLSLIGADGQVRWTTALPGGGTGGPPTIADMDGDGIPEIGVAGSNAYSAFRGDGSLLWSKPSQDWSSQITGSTVFDFDGDGVAEVLYADEIKLRVFKGPTGEVLWEQPNTSDTTLEYPLVVDVDADGHSDMLVVSNDFGWLINATERFHGVRAFEDVNNAWVPTRSVWNQHAYSINHINDDLSVPRDPEPSWKSHNTFRLNRRMDADARAIADVTASYVRVVDGGAQTPSQIIVRVGNAGSYKVPAGTPVAIYNTDPALGPPAAQALVAQGVTREVLPTGAFEDLAIVPARALAQLSAMGTVWIVADDDGTGRHTLADFDRGNNVAAADLGAIANHLLIAVATDKPTYAEADTARFTATVRNAGSFVRNALVRLTVLDAAGKSVDVLPLGTAAPLQPAASDQVLAPWSVAAVLAGDYQVRAELVTPQGLVYGTASAPFAVKAGAVAGAADNSLNSARASTDRSRYSAAHTVFIDSRVANLSANLLQENLRAVTQVIAPGGQVVLVQTEDIAQAVPRSQRKYGYYLPAGSLAPGTYQVRIQLFGSASYQSRTALAARSSARAGLGDVELASSTASFVVQDSLQSAVGITGQLGAAPAAVAIGASSALQLSVFNNGNAAIAGATVRVRVLDPGSGTPIAVFTQTGVQLPAGTGGQYSWNWVAAGTAGSVLPVAATIEIAGSEQPLAQATVTLTASAAQPPVEFRPVPLEGRWLLALLLLVPAVAHFGARRRPSPRSPLQSKP
ncbi:carboxypeptidase regulatory-like domain-containing protein [Paracidovorax konjaci]|uniref:Carboxypeptidase regulatory-like domain-containing protein n=1 Tax=Paracidovorax konjaci TaxID=32040 RepID=A0A1I1SHL2_9BURK|nr:carboxypeptidase regulatory-like domain-containing protein [Paracidovorax konjaci]SFD44128.1 Carboxypeptidase regulatory-like domain-containing protein [Paracidovorax konjaci]